MMAQLFTQPWIGRHKAAPVRLPFQPDLPFDGPPIDEIALLRKSRVYEDPAGLSAYGARADAGKTSEGLPVGTQSRFIAAAGVAARDDHPLNTLLTLRWSSLFSDRDVNWLRCLPVPQRIRKLIERIRKWLQQRDLPAFYIWVREVAGHEEEHLHVALHLPPRFLSDFATYVSEITQEARAPSGQVRDRTTGEFACGEARSWHIAKDIHPERKGYFLAAYLGKGEPSQCLFRGALRDNDQKSLRGLSYGGTQPDGKFDAPQGEVTGTARREARFHIAKPLQALMSPATKHVPAEMPPAPQSAPVERTGCPSPAPARCGAGARKTSREKAEIVSTSRQTKGKRHMAQKADTGSMTTEEQKGLILGILCDFIESDDLGPYLEHVGFDIYSIGPPGQLFDAWLGHYRIRQGFYDIDRAGMDLRSWPPIAARIAELQGKGWSLAR